MVEQPLQVRAEQEPVTVIRATRGWSSLGLHDVWEFRELLYFLIWRELRSRYRQMALGPLWIIITPLINMVVFTVIFGKLAKLSSDGLPYPIFAYAALLPWGLFATSASRAATSLVMNLRVISKVYFPRLVIPLAASVVGVVDFCMSFVILLGMMLYYGITPTAAVVTVPLFLLLAVATALAVGLWLAALAVKFRDVRYGVDFLLRIWMFACPIVYSISEVSTRVPEVWLRVYQLNPMVHVVLGFRWALLRGSGSFKGPAPDGMMLAASSALVLVLLISGAFCFRRTERTVVDYI